MLPVGDYECDIRFPFPTGVNLQDLLPQESAKGTTPFWTETSSSHVVLFPSPQTAREEQVTVEYHLTLIVRHGLRLLKRSTQYS